MPDCDEFVLKEPRELFETDDFTTATATSCAHLTHSDLFTAPK